MSGPKGNTNALKHGLYAKQFNDDQRKGLRKMSWEDFRHEVFAHRVIGAKIFELLQLVLEEVHRKQTDGLDPDIVPLTFLINSFSANSTATGTSARTHANLNGQDEPLGDALSEALGNVPFFEDERED